MSKSRAYCFTWNNYNGGSVEQITSYLDWEYVFQEEMGENGTPHLQGVIRFKNPRGIAFQNELSEKIHWERCRNWRASVKYCTKRDTRVGRVYTNVPGLKWRKSIRDPMEGKTLYPWEIAVLKILDEEPDTRKIYWVYDKKGCTGKSTFCKHLALKRGALIVGGSARDAKFAIVTVMEDRDPEIVCFDVARKDQNRISYTAIEEIKNGCFFSSKYEGKQCMFEIPHVIVFANCKPQFTMLSADRWVLIKSLVVRSTADSPKGEIVVCDLPRPKEE